MEMTVLGWARNHGKKEVLNGDLLEARVFTGGEYYSQGRVDLRLVHSPHRGYQHVVRGVKISGGASLRLGGDYLVQITLQKSEIARLFYLTHQGELENLLERIGEVREDFVERIGSLRGDFLEKLGSVNDGLLGTIGSVRQAENAGAQDEERDQVAVEAKATEAIPDLAFNPAFLMKVDDLELSPWSTNCLKNANIVYIGDLVQKTEAEMLRTPYFSRKSLNEIKEVLAQLGLHLGMEVPGWPPNNIDDLAERVLRGRKN
jgi:hypothetical protein